jgi:hypothetical protein
MPLPILFIAGVRFPAGSKIFLFSVTSIPTLGPTQSPIQWVSGGGDVSLEVKRLGHEADHSPPTSAQVKYGGAIPPLPGSTQPREDN